MGPDPAQDARAEPADESDADLLIYMSMADDDAAGARAAWEEFYRRHCAYLYAVCLRAYGDLLGGEPGAADLVAEAFMRAYEHADTFDAGGVADGDALRRQVRAWLGRIAHRLAQTVLRGRGRLPTRLLEHDQWQQIAEGERGDPADSPRARLAREALLSLTEREQMVLCATFQWYQPGQEHQRLPNDVAADLSETLQTTPENLRQVRRRALRKVRAYIDRHAGGHPSEEATP